MRFERCDLDRRNRNGFIRIKGEDFSGSLDVDWSTAQRAPYLYDCNFSGTAMPVIQFGFNLPASDWLMDIDAYAGEKGLMISSQGYRGLKGKSIPFLRSRKFFWKNPEMLFECVESMHLAQVVYSIDRIDESALKISPLLDEVLYERDGATLCWSFGRSPVKAGFEGGGWRFYFDTPQAEALLRWQRSPANFAPFISISPELKSLTLNGENGERALDTSIKHDAAMPGEAVQLPAGDAILTNDPQNSRMRELAVRRIAKDGTISIGATRFMELGFAAESQSMPMFRPYLIRALRSLKERMVFGVVPEDDPSQDYIWGTGTWPRCFSVTALDRFGFSRESYEYLEFMLDASRQFLPRDNMSHLWDNFYITGPRINDKLYDINGHSMKLYEAGKFYLRHRQDSYGECLRKEHYLTLRDWCGWIERHMEADGSVLDETESNVWAHGYGAFTQAPAAAGVKLFLNIASDAGRLDDAGHFSGVVKKLLEGLNSRLWGDAGNPYLGIPKGAGECYLTYVPAKENERNWWDQPVERIGLACYSLAAGYYLQDPEVGLLAADDQRCKATLDLALKHLGDSFDPKIITWHVRRSMAHMGYGQGQLLQCLLFAGRGEEFRERLSALFDVSRKEIGDAYLMQEVLGRSGNPNRGNKAHLAYFPFLAALLAGLDAPGLESNSRACLPDLRIHGTKA